MSKAKTKVIDLLNEMIEASSANTKTPLAFAVWHCGTACCACGDVAVHRNKGKDVDFKELTSVAIKFAAELDDKVMDLTNYTHLAGSIYESSQDTRVHQLLVLGTNYKSLLWHPHVSSDHSDRSILIDYIQKVIQYIEVNYE